CLSAYLLGWLHVPQRDHDGIDYVAGCPQHIDRSTKRPWMGLSGESRLMARKNLNVGLVGYGFMGRTHSNAFLQAPRFFDVPYQPVLKAVCARSAERAKGFAETWGYQSVETDWRTLIA